MSETKNDKIDTPDAPVSDGLNVGDTTAGAEIPTDKDAKPAAKRKDIGDLAQLLRAVYEGKFKRVSLKKTEIQALLKSLEMSAAAREEILELALTDRLLDKTRQLMLLSLRFKVAELSHRVREFAGEVLRRHPIFQIEKLDGVLANLPDAISDDRAIVTLLAVECDVLPWPNYEKPLTKAHCEQCRRNAVHCLLLHFFATRNTSLEKLHTLLQRNLWTRDFRRLKSDRDKVYALINSKDPTPASITFTLLDREVRETNRKLAAAERTEARIASRVAELERCLAEAEDELEAARRKSEQVEHELETAIATHRNELSHSNNDYEQLRGRMLRRLKEELALLDEGLYALRKETPKVHVMIDHAERAIDGLKREVENLRRSDAE